MKSDLQKQLKKLLKDGWQVSGFQQVVDSEVDDRVACPATSGFAVLLQKDENLAVATMFFQKGELTLNEVHMITGAE